MSVYNYAVPEETIKHNEELVKKYPFLFPRNRFTDKVVEDYDYSWTELDEMPEGWKIAFGEQLCEELTEELKKYNYLDDYRIVQIKEKFGSLRWYDNYHPKGSKMSEIIVKYELISQHTCIKCGKKATKESIGWICPWCDDCADKVKDRWEFIDIVYQNNEVEDK